jgi:hypothetical protein
VPRPYVIPSRTVADNLKRAHATWLAAPGKNGKVHRGQRCVARRTVPALAVAVEAFSDGWIEAHRNVRAANRWAAPSRRYAHGPAQHVKPLALPDRGDQHPAQGTTDVGGVAGAVLADHEVGARSPQPGVLGCGRGIAPGS